MTTQPDRGLPWVRIFVEGLVIVGSILLAFGIDAWWDERQDRLAERDALARLHAEFTENRERIDPSRVGGGTFRRVAATSEALYRTMELLPPGTESLSVSDSILVRVIEATTFDPVTPVLDGLVRSARLEIIRDPQVRAAISTWEYWLARLAETEGNAREFTEDRLRPALLTHGDVSRVFATPATEIDPEGVTVLRVDAELEGLVADKHARARSIIGFREQLTDSVDELLLAISRVQGG